MRLSERERRTMGDDNRPRGSDVKGTGENREGRDHPLGVGENHQQL